MPTTETFQGKACRVCGGTERHSKTKRCIACKQRLDKAAWERKKAAMTEDTEKRKAYRAGVRERMSRYNAKKKAEYEALSWSEKFHIDQERAAARAARNKWL
ncbi:hypothetical protein LE610_004402 [Salmonella enterica]|nr:hypothetical protein [Salmonella enterica]EDR5032847.1 hypothetical protein [Salmonella enterica]EHR9955819.1 hypothetical protein [Salmonella enterica]EIF1022365.1 hypothetical protein [Salmonella enterica]EII3827884.1 hypothetical protein [Salmonella enterica]